MDPSASAHWSQMWASRSWISLDFSCQIHSSSFTAVFQ